MSPREPRHDVTLVPNISALPRTPRAPETGTPVAIIRAIAEFDDKHIAWLAENFGPNRVYACRNHLDVDRRRGGVISALTDPDGLLDMCVHATNMYQGVAFSNGAMTRCPRCTQQRCINPMCTYYMMCPCGSPVYEFTRAEALIQYLNFYGRNSDAAAVRAQVDWMRGNCDLEGLEV